MRWKWKSMEGHPRPLLYPRSRKVAGAGPNAPKKQYPCGFPSVLLEKSRAVSSRPNHINHLQRQRANNAWLFIVFPREKARSFMAVCIAPRFFHSMFMRFTRQSHAVDPSPAAIVSGPKAFIDTFAGSE
jgi:hypothetical protein